ncbi:hypothetical protein [Flavobacterium algicola]|uniref:hypothetical protein n=1 Tax=Flavobacterium algicola TaxID=556529 RepID=UPI001EFD086F|nr:hypothetical protein [Flavobacterium algicola]MCG9793828.1 hypothetical protein [Flavobacterium algicola]
MKILKLVALSLLFFVSSAVQSQVSVNVNIGPRPTWAPAEGYTTVDYYYIPEVQAYYDTHSSVFIYLNGSSWVRAKNLPSRYSKYDINSCQKVVLKGYKGDKPYQHFDSHKKQYKAYKKENKKNNSKKSNKKH